MGGKGLIVFVVGTGCVVAIWHFTGGLFEGTDPVIYDLLMDEVPAGGIEAKVGTWTLTSMKLGLLGIIAALGLYALADHLRREPDTFYRY